MISRKRKTLYYGLLLVMSSILPIAIYAQNAHAYIILEGEATYLTNYGLGFWAEVTLEVQVRIYYGGAMAFFYSESHRQSKPWFAFYAGTNNGVRLYEESSGTWRVSNTRTVIFFGIHLASVIARVHFNENDMNFYYSEFIWDKGVLVVQNIMKLMGPFYEHLT